MDTQPIEEDKKRVELKIPGVDYEFVKLERGRIDHIELCDFKSYKGTHTVGPFAKYIDDVALVLGVIAGADKDRIIACYQNATHKSGVPPTLFGVGKSAQAIVNCMDAVNFESKINDNKS